MSYLKFEKSELVNLEYSLSRELIRSNRAGSYAATTIIGCNTRKYHGLLVCPLEEMDDEHHVLLSTLDATVVQHNKEFNLGIHKYEGDHYVPKGHKYCFISGLPGRWSDLIKGGYAGIERRAGADQIYSTRCAFRYPVASATISGIPEFSCSKQIQSLCQYQVYGGEERDHVEAV